MKVKKILLTLTVLVEKVCKVVYWILLAGILTMFSVSFFIVLPCKQLKDPEFPFPIVEMEVGAIATFIVLIVIAFLWEKWKNFLQ